MLSISAQALLRKLYRALEIEEMSNRRFIALSPVCTVVLYDSPTQTQGAGLVQGDRGLEIVECNKQAGRIFVNGQPVHMFRGWVHSVTIKTAEAVPDNGWSGIRVPFPD